MNRSNLIIEKLLDKTARKEFIWWPFSNFSDYSSLPFFGYQHLVPEESYFYSYGDGHFFLATFKATANDAKIMTELILGFQKSSEKNFDIISKDQEKLFELKSLIEYEEPEKEIKDILDDFLNDNE
ncbi:hypothetical protein [Enterococcus gilvus]|uniref:hypothetical protein n=1 Tax=Enterococcus gilvus TaxID=160453 RepID=UPI001C8BED8B|nr:hypothetical protein [Enterococcus gilvus]MBX8938500.1 hypothetical protein [Enterococcus gilvus]